MNDSNTQLTFNSLLARQAEKFGHRTCITFEDKVYSYADVHRISDAIAAGLYEAGVRHGTTVAILIDNKPEIILLYLSIAKLGAISAPINTAAVGEFLRSYAELAAAKIAVCDAEYVERLSDIATDVEISTIFYVGDLKASPNFAGSVQVNVRCFSELLDARDQYQAQPVVHSDPYMLLFTSGTTGKSKASVATHHSSIELGHTMAKAYKYVPEDVLYICLPLFHGNAWQCATVPALVAGASVAITRRFSATKFWDEVRSMGVTQFNIMSAMTTFLWSQPRSEKETNHSVKQCMLVPVPVAFYEEFKARFGIKTIQSVYALTDAGVISITTDDDPNQHFSTGKINPLLDVRIFDDEDYEVAPGMTGEIVVRPKEPWVMPLGYYRDPARTLEAWRNLWFHTGDRGYFDPNGYLYFVDRKKDAIRRRGENISSYEVEQIILKHPLVDEVAAFPLPSEFGEDEVAVSVIPKSKLSPEELIEYCEMSMPRYMVPRFVEFTSSFPLTMTGKIEKYKLRETAQSDIGRFWDRDKAAPFGKRAPK